MSTVAEQALGRCTCPELVAFSSQKPQLCDGPQQEGEMGIGEELAAELKDAIKTGDKPRRNVIRQVQTEMSVARSAPGFSGEVDDGLYVEVIASYVKKMSKARAEFEAAGERGAEQAAKLAYEVDYLSRWLPQLAGEDETRAIVRAAIEELGVSDPKMAGRVTGHIMKSGQDLDGGLVNRLVREELGA
jgi:hypothetical protein